MKKFACALLLLVTACPSAEDIDTDAPADTEGPAGDERCANGGVAVGWPLAPGSYQISQGNGGAFSHNDGFNDFAFDFSLAPGTEVVAARGGTVAVVVDGFGEGGPDPAFNSQVNFVVIDHGGGTFDRYLHLQAGGMAKAVGDVVRSGDVIALSGNSGFTSGPHLHFAVVDAFFASVPSCFAPGDQVPDTGDEIDAVASPLREPTAFPRSTLPGDTFADFGIVIDNVLTALSVDGSVHVEGHVTDGNARAAVFLAPLYGGGIFIQSVVDVDDAGAFVADLDCSDFPGLRGLGMSSVNGTFFSNLVPVVVSPG